MDSRHTSLLERDSWGKSMKHKAPVFTLALLGALALAALFPGGLLPSDSAVHAQPADESNNPPGFDRPIPASRDVPRTRRRASTSAPYLGHRPDEDGEDDDDLEFGDTLTYSLEARTRRRSIIDPSTGQLSTKAPLDYEDQESITLQRDGDGGGQRRRHPDTIMSDHHRRDDRRPGPRRASGAPIPADGGVGRGPQLSG